MYLPTLGYKYLSVRIIDVWTYFIITITIKYEQVGIRSVA